MPQLSKKAGSAEKYIRYATRDNVQQRELKLDEHGRICVDKHKSIVLNHVALANNFVKLASITPMSAMSRKIIQLKLINPGITMVGIGLQTGLLNHEINAYEREGLTKIANYIRVNSLQEATDKFNTERTVEHAVKNLNVQGKKNSLLTTNPS